MTRTRGIRPSGPLAHLAHGIENIFGPHTGLHAGNVQRRLRVRRLCSQDETAAVLAANFHVFALCQLQQAGQILSRLGIGKDSHYISIVLPQMLLVLVKLVNPDLIS